MIKKIVGAALALASLTLVAGSTTTGVRAAASLAQPASSTPVSREFQPFGLDASAHAGFPATTRLPSGQVRMMWRESSGHLASDGKTMTSLGNPLTGEWSAPVEVQLDLNSPSRDMRPAALSTIGNVVWLTYFFWENGVPAGAYVTKSSDGGASFGTSVRVDGGRPYAAISGPVVQVAGRLVAAWYGRNAGEAVDTAWVSTSVNDGATWTQVRIANAIGAGKAYNEPWPLTRGNTLMILMRDGGWSGLAMRASPDGGATWPPNPGLVRILDNATANSASVWAPNGNLYVVYRHTVTRDAMLAVSRDSGATWQSDPAPLLRAPANLGIDSVGMTYAAPVVLGDGLVWCPIGMERSLDSSRIFAGWL